MAGVVFLLALAGAVVGVHQEVAAAADALVPATKVRQRKLSKPAV